MQNSEFDLVVNFVTFNQDFSCIGVAHNKGFSVCHSNPFAHSLTRGMLCLSFAILNVPFFSRSGGWCFDH